MIRTMRIFLLSLILIGLFVVPAFSQEVEDSGCTGTPLGVFVNLNSSSIQLIDPVTMSYSPVYLRGMLGTGGLLDVAITSDGNTAIVSNFGDSKIYALDISGGFDVEPRIIGWQYTRFFAEDLVITPDDKYVLITDGGLSSAIVVIEIATMRFVQYYQTPNDAQAIEIAPDGRTVLTVDYLGGGVDTYLLAEDGIITHQARYRTSFWPINVSISPDGKTVLVPLAFQSVILVYEMWNGILIPKGTVAVQKSGQSCLFSKDGTKAYYLQNGDNIGTTVLSILDINGPGQVSHSGINIDVTPGRGTGQFFGIESMALDPSGRYLYITNPSSSGVRAISILDLTTNTQVGYHPAENYPTGISFTCQNNQ